jgi:hypothetical protein
VKPGDGGAGAVGHPHIAERLVRDEGRTSDLHRGTGVTVVATAAATAAISFRG